MKKVFSIAPAAKIMATVLLATACLLPSVARAEVKAGSFEVNPFAGYNLFEDSQNLKNRLIYGGRLGYNFTDHFELEGALEFVNTRVDDKSLVFGKRGQYRSPMDKVDIAFYHLDALYHFMPESRFNPFVVAGVGAAQYSPKISNHDMAVVDFGVGAKYWLAEHVALRVDVRDNVVSEVFRYAYHNVQATAGLVFAFGGRTHAEVVAAETAAAAAAANPTVATVECPVPAKDTTAPTVSLTAPVNGAADMGTRRKVYVSFSEPVDPATMNSSTFYLLQDKERVPGTVSDVTATSASITPTNALSPGTLYTARVTTGTKDLAGNALAKDYVWSFTTASVPEQKVETKVVIINKFVMLEDTHFQFDKAELTPEGKHMLDQNVKIMQDNPELKVRIAGFTSAAGTPAYNQGLSERRAGAARTYMVDAGGIAPERLDTIGYGATRPAVFEANPSDMESKAARANMRVLFEVVVK
jgi:outer membrane beta-barrel protein